MRAQTVKITVFGKKSCRTVAADRLVRTAIRAAFAEIVPNSERSCDVTFVDDEMMKKINREQRGVDKTTDVLSFPMFEEFAGDILLNTAQISRQAVEYNHPFERECAYMAVHGALHLLGFDHEKAPEKREMRQKEEFILRKIGLSND